MFESDPFSLLLLLLLLLLLPRRKLLRTAAATHDVFRWGGGVADEAAARLVRCDQGREGRVNNRIPRWDMHAPPKTMTCRGKTGNGGECRSHSKMDLRSNLRKPVSARAVGVAGGVIGGIRFTLIAAKVL